MPSNIVIFYFTMLFAITTMVNGDICFKSQSPVVAKAKEENKLNNCFQFEVSQLYKQ